MSETTAIEWTDSTVNFWWGCTKVGPGCDHCYAEAWALRFDDALWGAGVPRRKVKSAMPTLAKLQSGAAHWEAQHGRRRRVFLQSMSDLFDKEVPDTWFDEAWTAIGAATGLELQIVTKRVSFVEKRLAGRPWPQHAGLIISVVNQEEADRDIPRLLELKSRLGIPWVGLSMEPLLGPVDLSGLMFVDKECPNSDMEGSTPPADPETGAQECCTHCDWTGVVSEAAIDWVIVGGESGPSARPMHPDWARSLRDQCAAAGVPFLFKQWGEWEPLLDRDRDDPDWRADYSGRCADRGSTKWLNLAGGCGFHGERFHVMKRVGKKHAGRLLDGVEHNGFPR
jgi:protein gp37